VNAEVILLLVGDLYAQLLKAQQENAALQQENAALKAELVTREEAPE